MTAYEQGRLGLFGVFLLVGVIIEAAAVVVLAGLVVARLVGGILR